MMYRWLYKVLILFFLLKQLSMFISLLHFYLILGSLQSRICYRASGHAGQSDIEYTSYFISCYSLKPSYFRHNALTLRMSRKIRKFFFCNKPFIILHPGLLCRVCRCRYSFFPPICSNTEIFNKLNSIQLNISR